MLMLLRPSTAFRLCASALLLAVLFQSGASAGYQDEIGFTALQAELGATLATGTNVRVSQVEAYPSMGSVYLPDPANPEFSGKSFMMKSGTSAPSGHATTVGTYFYGITSSQTPGVPTIDCYEANDFLSSLMLRWGTVHVPWTEIRDVENHSWIGSFGNTTDDMDVLRRMDYLIQRDDFVAAVGVNNGSANPVPVFLSQAYNVISVGLTNGNHSTGQTTIEVAGRVKPEIVVPLTLTSYATPVVGSSAALLISKARVSYPLAANSMVVKALLMAGATKSEIPGWNRTTTRPLDAHYGAGELNILNSYHILTAGQQQASASVERASRGWDATTTASGGRLYFFEIPTGKKASTFSALLTWNRSIITSPTVWSPVPSVADLRLRLYQASGFTLGALVDSSDSAVDNVEHVFQTNLPAGHYALEVAETGSGTSYGIAWDAQVVTSPTVNVTAVDNAASESGPDAGKLTVTRTSTEEDGLPLNVYYSVGGTASNGADYQTLSGTVQILANSLSADIDITPIPDSAIEGSETVDVTLLSDSGYFLGGSTNASVTIADKPFDAWRFANFTSIELADPLISGELADPDSDGIPNLTEFGEHLLPKTPDSGSGGLPSAEVVGGALRLIFTRVKAATDLIYRPRVTTDLATWNFGPSFIQEISVVDQGETEEVTVEAFPPSGGEPQQFMDLQIERQ